MLRLLRWLFTGDGHAHKWTKIGVTNVVPGGEIVPEAIITLQCVHCGNIKTTKIKN